MEGYFPDGVFPIYSITNSELAGTGGNKFKAWKIKTSEIVGGFFLL